MDDVDGMLARMTAEQFAELEAADRLQPFGTEKICWVIATCFADLFNGIFRKEGEEPFDPRRFIPWRREEMAREKSGGLTPNAAAALLRLSPIGQFAESAADREGGE